MKTIFTVTFLIFFLGIKAQNPCGLTPEITNGDIILCPNENDTLQVSGGPYAAYQWLRDGQDIAGATDSILPISQYADAGYHFSVRVDSAGCTATSPEILVDGWVFLLPTVISEGDFTIDPQDGSILVCEGDLLRLTLNQPYTTNIQWRRNNIDIPGANQNMYNVTQSGFYDVSGAPGVCPDFIQSLGVLIDVEVLPNPLPSISLMNGQLVCNVLADDYLWYRNGTPIGNSNSQSITPTQSGSYTVSTFWDSGCDNLSAPFVYQTTAVDDPNQAFPTRLYPQPAMDVLYVEAPGLRQIQLFDPLGRPVTTVFDNDAVQINVSDLPVGWYSLRLVFDSGKATTTKVMVGK
jgi:Secretion system C-terminal sorting domain